MFYIRIKDTVCGSLSRNWIASRSNEEVFATYEKSKHTASFTTLDDARLWWKRESDRLSWWIDSYKIRVEFVEEQIQYTVVALGPCPYCNK